MKIVLSKVVKSIGSVFGLLLALFLGLCFVFLLPIDYIKYKCSRYYKKEQKKYKLFAGTGIYFEFYNEIAKYNLPIKYIFNPTNDELDFGWFVIDKTLLILGFPFEYSVDDEKWVCKEYDDDNLEVASISLEDYLTQEIDEINKLLDRDVCNEAVVLADANDIENIDKAKEEKSFLIYEDRVETLKEFCKNRMGLGSTD